MNAKSQMVGEAKKGTSGLVRPKFAPGQLLRDDDLQQAVTYTRELSRLLFRSFFGCGVICGLKVSPPEFECGKLCVNVDGGVALACNGDPVRVPAATKVVADFDCLQGEPPKTLWVLLRGYEKCCAPRAAMCGNDDDAQNVCTREVDGFEIRLVTDLPPCVCGCPPKKAASEASGAADSAREAQGQTGAKPDAPDCQCADPNRNCYQGHYQGTCGCPCCDPAGDCSGTCSGDCGCEWILLSHLTYDATKGWAADNTVRRFIRPVLARETEIKVKTASALTSTQQASAGGGTAAAKKTAAKRAAKKTAGTPGGLGG
jgi:hypothetical protein